MSYEGCKNYFTWLTYTWLTKEENIYKQMQVIASDARQQIKPFAQEIKALIADFNNPISGQESLYNDILDTAFEEIDWEEIAENFLKEEQ